jgi:septal ring factor EnvC (AmiA/AmiB activator)
MRTLWWYGTIAILLAAACAAAAQQDDRTRAGALAARAAARIQALHEEADRLAKEERTVLNELRRFEVERQLRNAEYAEAERKRIAVEDQIGTLDRQIATLEREEQAALPILRARLTSLYKLGRGSYARLLFSTSDLGHLARASRMISVLATEDRTRIAAHQARRTELLAARSALQQQQAELTTLQAAAAEARAAVDRAVAARTARVSEIDRSRDLNAQLAGELIAAEQRLHSTVSQLGSGAAAASATTLPVRPFRGDLDWPVAGSVRQPFGASLPDRAAPSSGIDVAAVEGTAVRAIHDGRVAFADTFSGFGRLVVVDHGENAFSLYGNLEDVAVRQGDRVGRGDLVGTVGVSPIGAAGLYFELRIDGRPVDPLQWLKAK